MSVKRWTLYVCKECGEDGWAFEANRSECDPIRGVHCGKHGGPVEVMPVSDYEVVEAEAKALEERAVGAEVLANDYCEAKEQASVDLREFGGHKAGCSNYRASRDCDCGFHAALRRNP